MARALKVPPSAALEEMLRQDAENGVEVLDDAPAPPGPPEQVAPLIRPSLPPPDWRAEEAERAQRESESDTPNLDRVKSWEQAR
jgi:hypothetical protein